MRPECGLAALVVGLIVACCGLPTSTDRELVVAALRRCQPHLAMAEARSGLPLRSTAAKTAVSEDCMQDLLNTSFAEDEHSLSHGVSACEGTRVMRSVLGECQLERRLSSLYAGFSRASTERQVLQGLMDVGFARVRADRLRECSGLQPTLNIDFGGPDFSNTNPETILQLQQIACMVHRLHGGLQGTSVIQQNLRSWLGAWSSGRRPQVMDWHWDSIFPVFKAWYYKHATCAEHGAIVVNTGSHRLTASRLWWIHDGGPRAALSLNVSKLGFNRRMLTNRGRMSPMAAKLSAPAPQQQICGKAGDVVFLDARALHARGNISVGQSRNMFYISTNSMKGANARAFRAFASEWG